MSPPTDGGATTTEDLDQAPAAESRSEGWNRGLPSLPRFTRPPRPRAESPAAGTGPDPGDRPAGRPAPGPTGPPGRDPDGPRTTGANSSPGFTDERVAAGRDKGAGEEWVDPRDLQAAVRQATDVAFVLVGQGLGSLERRARGLERVSEKWVPTKDERELVLAPAGRIARRHIHADRVALDTIDGCMMAAGVGAFAMRGWFGVEAVAPEHAPAPDVPHSRTAPQGPADAGRYPPVPPAGPERFA